VKSCFVYPPTAPCRTTAIPQPYHSHTRDELYVWLKGPFTYIAADGKQAEIYGPAYISLPSNTPLALKCHNEPCVLYVRYGRPFDRICMRCRIGSGHAKSWRGSATDRSGATVSIHFRRLV
jgi:hypothetical protein